MQASMRIRDTTYTGFTIGKVVKTWPQANMVDIVLFGGSFFPQVQVITPFASSRSGSAGLPEIVREDETRILESAKYNESDVFAVIGFMGDSIRRPVCFGFLFPEENELLCDRTQAGNEDGTQFLYKHPSNIYVRVAKGKDQEEGKTPELEISHPSGLFIRIGTALDDGGSPAVPILREITNYDDKIRPFKKLNPDNDTADAAPTVRLYHPAGTTLFIDAEGSVTVHVEKDVTTTVKGNVNETIDGNVIRRIKGTLDETIDLNVTKHMKQAVTETIDGTLTEDIGGDLDQDISGDKTTDVSGTETDTVTGHWERDSSTSIKDGAPRIDHN